MRERILAMIKDYIMEHGYPPTVREIGRAVGLNSTSTVHHYLREMIADGMLETDAGTGSPRALRVPRMKMVDEKDGLR